jgi:prefoldin subunit 5
MSSQSQAVKRLEEQSCAAEKLIVALRREINALKSQASPGSLMSHEEEIEFLKNENAGLKKSIDEWKVKLVQAEQKSGGRINVPSGKPSRWACCHQTC